MPNELIDASVVVAPLRGTPEYMVFNNILREYNGGIIWERDPQRALMLALAYPRSRFSRVIFGIDPGKKCGVAGLGDDLLVYASKEPCEAVGSILTNLRLKVPSKNWEVYVGNGHGFLKAIESLENSKIDYVIVDESGTTRSSRRNLYARGVKDRDIIASMAIALRGAYGVGRVPDRIR